MRFLGLVGAFLIRRVLFFLLLCCPLLALADVASDLIADGIDAADILYVYSWGMGVVLTMWAIGFVAGVAVKVINAL
jgi:hypothetical protein